MNGYMKGIRLRAFLDNVAEWHALVNGLCEVLCPWPPFRKPMSRDRAKEVEEEYHYYVFGRVLGILAWLAIAKLIQEVFL